MWLLPRVAFVARLLALAVLSASSSTLQAPVVMAGDFWEVAMLYIIAALLLVVAAVLAAAAALLSAAAALVTAAAAVPAPPARPRGRRCGHAHARCRCTRLQPLAPLRLTQQADAPAAAALRAFRVDDSDGVEASYSIDHAKATICLLYTSPSPRDGLLSRMPSSA